MNSFYVRNEDCELVSAADSKEAENFSLLSFVKYLSFNGKEEESDGPSGSNKF